MRRKTKCIKCWLKRNCWAYKHKVQEQGCYYSGYTKSKTKKGV